MKTYRIVSILASLALLLLAAATCFGAGKLPQLMLPEGMSQATSPNIGEDFKSEIIELKLQIAELKDEVAKLKSERRSTQASVPVATQPQLVPSQVCSVDPFTGQLTCGSYQTVGFSQPVTYYSSSGYSSFGGGSCAGGSCGGSGGGRVGIFGRRR